jgi:hypothetical protein
MKAKCGGCFLTQNKDEEDVQINDDSYSKFVEYRREWECAQHEESLPPLN